MSSKPEHLIYTPVRYLRGRGWVGYEAESTFTSGGAPYHGWAASLALTDTSRLQLSLVCEESEWSRAKTAVASVVDTLRLPGAQPTDLQVSRLIVDQADLAVTAPRTWSLEADALDSPPWTVRRIGVSGGANTTEAVVIAWMDDYQARLGRLSGQWRAIAKTLEAPNDRYAKAKAKIMPLRKASVSGVDVRLWDAWRGSGANQLGTGGCLFTRGDRLYYLSSGAEATAWGFQRALYEAIVTSMDFPSGT